MSLAKNIKNTRLDYIDIMYRNMLKWSNKYGVLIKRLNY